MELSIIITYTRILQVIELHDDDVLSGLLDLTCDHFVLVAGDVIFLNTHARGYGWFIFGTF